jgi:hypothetical protein
MGSAGSASHDPHALESGEAEQSPNNLLEQIESRLARSNKARLCR